MAGGQQADEERSNWFYSAYERPDERGILTDESTTGFRVTSPGRCRCCRVMKKTAPYIERFIQTYIRLHR